LWIGAAGQGVFFAALFPRCPRWVAFSLLLLPWLTIYTISFCRRPPCGPRIFRLVLVAAMCWYAAATLLAESLNLLVHASSWGHSLVIARVLMYFGDFSFVVFLRFCARLRGIERELGP